MKTFGKFLREALEMLPGTVVILIKPSSFNQRTMYGVSTGRVIFKVTDLRQHGSEFQGITHHHEILDPYGLQMEVLLQGLQIGDTVKSSLQLDGLPNASIIESSIMHSHGLPDTQYKKIDGIKWVKVGFGTATKYDSFHFDMSHKYVWKS